MANSSPIVADREDGWRAFQVVLSVFSFAVAAVSLVGWHEWIAGFVLVELCGFEGQFVGSQFAIVGAYPVPFVLVGAETQNLQFDGAMCTKMLLGNLHVAESIQGFLQAASYAIGGIALLGKSVDG